MVVQTISKVYIEVSVNEPIPHRDDLGEGDGWELRPTFRSHF